MMPSQHSAQRFIKAYVGRGGVAHQPRGQDVALLRQIVFNQIARRHYGITIAKLHEAVIDEYGSCVRRRLERAVAWLLDAGRIERIDFGVYRLAKSRAKKHPEREAAEARRDP